VGLDVLRSRPRPACYYGTASAPYPEQRAGDTNWTARCWPDRRRDAGVGIPFTPLDSAGLRPHSGKVASLPSVASIGAQSVRRQTRELVFPHHVRLPSRAARWPFHLLSPARCSCYRRRMPLPSYSQVEVDRRHQPHTGRRLLPYVGGPVVSASRRRVVNGWNVPALAIHRQSGPMLEAVHRSGRLEIESLSQPVDADSPPTHRPMADASRPGGDGVSRLTRSASWYFPHSVPSPRRTRTVCHPAGVHICRRR